MAIFSRRDIQRMIFGLSDFLPRGKLGGIVDRLNLQSVQALDAEWELAILFALRGSGCIKYEPNLGGPSKIDILFRDNQDTYSEFLADVTCVSEEGLNKQNPSDFLQVEFIRLMRALGHSGNGCHLQIGGENKGVYPDQWVRLKLPGNKDITAIFEKELPTFQSEIASNPAIKRTLPIKTDRMDVLITYDPRSWAFGWGHASYDVPYSLTRNPVRNALKRKIGQLERSGYSGVKGIFLCDGGCSVLKRTTQSISGFSLTAILKDFMREHTAISFVITLLSERRSSTYQLTGTLTVNPEAKHKPKEPLLDILREIPKELPVPVSDSKNARNWLGRGMDEGKSFFGGLRMDSQTVRISSRTLHELLAGRIDQRRFLEGHGFVPSEGQSSASNPFATKLDQGRLISEVTVEKMENHDDDWITIHFGEEDAAISKFRKPGSA